MNAVTLNVGTLVKAMQTVLYTTKKWTRQGNKINSMNNKTTLILDKQKSDTLAKVYLGQLRQADALT